MVKRALICLDRLHWLWLALAAPFLLFPSPKRSPVMLIVPALFLLRWLAIRGKPQPDPDDSKSSIQNQRSAIPCTPLNGALLLMMMMVLVSLWATNDIVVSLPAISSTVLGLGVYYTFVRLGQESRKWWVILTFFLVAVILLAIVGLFGTTWGTKIGFFSSVSIRIPPLLIGLPGVDEGLNPNEVAGALIWGLPLMIAISIGLFSLQPPIKHEDTSILKKEWQRKICEWRLVLLKILCLALTFFIASVILLSQSRGAYFGLALTLPVLILIPLPPRWRRYSLALIALLAIILGVLLASHWGGVRTWIMGSDLATDPALSLNTLKGRLEVWSRAIYGIQDFPFTGMGMNAFRKVMPVLYPLFNISPDIDIGHAHNEFLQAALDLGIPGLIAFITLYLGAFRMLFQIWQDRSLQNSPVTGMISDRWLTVGLGSGLLAHMLYSLIDAIPLMSKYSLLFWMLLGLVAGLYEQTCSKKIVSV